MTPTDKPPSKGEPHSPPQPWLETFDAKVALALIENALQTTRTAKALLSLSTRKHHVVLGNALDHSLAIFDKLREELKQDLKAGG
jgi:hypothetical protein